MLPFFTNQTPLVLGIDLGSTSVRLLELSRSGFSYQVESYGIEYLPNNAVIEKEIKDVGEVGAAIERLVRQTKPSTLLAAIAVPASAVINKVLQFPATMTEQEIEAQLTVEAERYIPYTLEEVTIDFAVMGANREQGDTVNILLVAARSEQVDTRVAAVEAGGLVVKIVDAEIYAVERIYSQLRQTSLCAEMDRDGPPHYVAIYHIGTAVTTLDVLCDGVNIYSRDQSFGGMALIHLAMEAYGMTLSEAFIAKNEHKWPDDYETRLMAPFRRAVLQHIRRSLQLFFSSTDCRAVDLILLAGGSTNVPGLVALIKEDVGVNVLIANPLAHMTLDSRIRRQACLADSASLWVSCGLAMRSFVS